MAKPKKRCSHMFFADVPTDLRNKFKATCAEQETTMRDKFLTFMRKVVNKNVDKQLADVASGTADSPRGRRP